MKRVALAMLSLSLLAQGCGRSHAPARKIVPTDADGEFDPPGTVGPAGGHVARLHLAVTGDTRGADADVISEYPTPIIQQIFSRMAGRKVQFALDLGDHMNVDASGLAGADAQMRLYTGAAATLGAPLFMTLGNHECPTSCGPTSTPPSYLSFLASLQPISARPFYAIDVQTQGGLARFVIVADNAWDDVQARWLEETLSDADLHARYTIVLRHHPRGDSRFASSLEIIDRHRLALLLTGHSHQYLHDLDADPSGRTAIVGTGGAPLGHGWDSFGYGVITQGDDGLLTYTQFDAATDTPVDQWQVGPN